MLLSITDFVHQGFWEGKKPGRGKGGEREMLNSKLELESNETVSFSVIAWIKTYTMAVTYQSISSYMR